MNVEYKVMTAEDYDGVYELWTNTPGMGINSTDDSREGIEKYIKRNPATSFAALVEGKISSWLPVHFGAWARFFKVVKIQKQGVFFQNFTDWTDSRRTRQGFSRTLS